MHSGSGKGVVWEMEDREAEAVWGEKPWDLDPFNDSHQGEERSSGRCDGEGIMPVILKCLVGKGPFKNLMQADFY